MTRRQRSSNQLISCCPTISCSRSSLGGRCGTITAAIRCAATSKSLRRGILQAPFLRHLRSFLLLRHGWEHGDNGGRPFMPNLLLGVYHQSHDPNLLPPFVSVTISDGAKKLLATPLADTPPSAPNGQNAAARAASACDFGPYLPVASSRSLLVLRRRCKSTVKEHLIERHGLHPVELSVCNPTTGERRRVLPPHDVQDMSHALLDVDPIAAPSSSFKLLVAELSDNDPSTLYVQIFSSEEDVRGPVLAYPIVSRFSGESPFEWTRGRPRCVVLGDTVYWLCTSRLGHRILAWRWRGGGGVAHEAWIGELPVPLGYSVGGTEKCLAVLPSSADTRGSGSQPQALLGMIAIEVGKIEVWACERSGGGGGAGGSASAGEWKLWRRIKEEIITWLMDSSNRWLGGAELSWFCEGSGTLFLRPRDGMLTLRPLPPLLFNLDTMKACTVDARGWGEIPEFCPYEIDPLSHMLFVMKRF